MQSQWTTQPLASIARIVGGGTPSTKNDEYWGGDVPWITPKDLSTHQDRYIARGERNITQKGFRESGAQLLPAGTVLVSSRAPIGYVAIASQPVTTNQGFKSLVLHNGNSPEFFYYVLNSSTALLESHASGTTFKELSGSAMARIEVPVPPLNEQRRIAAVLGALDDKIAANRRMNATLEALAQAVFHERFGRYAPGDPLPDGWKEQTIGEIAQAVGGSTPPTKNPEYWAGGTLHWTSPKDLSNASTPVLLGTERLITEAGLATISSGLLPVHTVLLSSRAPVGYLTLSKIPIAVNQGYIALPPGDVFPPHFLFHWVKAHLPIVKARAGGTTFPEISKRSFRTIPALVPPPGEVQAFEHFAEQIFDTLTANDLQNRTLAATRDALLPRLLSGELRVAEAEALV